MKTETNSFTPTSGPCTIVLDDDTMNVKGVYFQVRKNGSNVNVGTGFSDSIKNRGGYNLDDTVQDSQRSTAYCVFNNKLSGGVSTTANRGKVNANGFSATGEIDMTFDNVDNAYTVDFFAIGD
jgi:hypothetical protein